MAQPLLTPSVAAVPVYLGQVVAILGSQVGMDIPWLFDTRQEAVVIAIRLTQVLLGLLIGAGLAVTAWIVLGVPLLQIVDTRVSYATLSLAVFAGSIAATLIVYRHGRTVVATMNSRGYS